MCIRDRLKFDGAVEVVEEVAPALKDGGFILILRKLVVNVLVLDRLGVKGMEDAPATRKAIILEVGALFWKCPAMKKSFGEDKQTLLTTAWNLQP